MSDAKIPEMVERVAHQVALEVMEATAQQEREWRWSDDFNGDTVDRARTRAAKIISAIREPTETMVDAGRDYSGWSGRDGLRDGAREGYRAMIDAAQKERAGAEAPARPD